jgi:hypothetical protein
MFSGVWSGSPFFAVFFWRLFFGRFCVGNQEQSLQAFKREENRQLALLPEFPELVKLAEGWEPGKYAKPSGKILSQDEELCEEVCRRVLMGDSDRRIARDLQISRNSIKAVESVMAASGKLEPLKQRLLKDLGEVAVLSLSRYKEALEDDLVSPQFLMVGAAIAIDKKELLAGGVTSRVEAVERVEWSLDTFEAAARRLLEEKRAKAIELPVVKAIEVGSSGEVLQTGGLSHE